MTIPPDRQWLLDAIETHESGLIRYAASLVGDVDVARDLVQETFLRLLKAGATVRDHLTPWLFKVCRNLAMDIKRKESHMESTEMTLARKPSLEPDPEASIERRDLSGKVTVALNHLPPNQQEVIRLKFQHEMSYKQISEVTSLSVSNVGFLIHTALKTLRGNLADQATAARGGVS